MSIERLKKMFTERVGEKITEEQIIEITELIVQGKAELAIWEKGQKEAVYKVDWNALTFYAVFNIQSKKIITFKNLDMKIILNPEEEWY